MYFWLTVRMWNGLRQMNDQTRDIKIVLKWKRTKILPFLISVFPVVVFFLCSSVTRKYLWSYGIIYISHVDLVAIQLSCSIILFTTLFAHEFGFQKYSGEPEIKLPKNRGNAITLHQQIPRIYRCSKKAKSALHHSHKDGID